MNRPLKILLVIGALFYATFIYRTAFQVEDKTYFTLVDDAMISMRYAQHLAQGHGLVWNIGEAPVEGFTNPGWTLIMAFVHLFPFSAAQISLVIMILAAFILLCNAFVTYKIAEQILPSAKVAPLIAATITAFYFPIVFWSLRGLEVGALTLAIGFSTLLALSHPTTPKPVAIFWLTLSLCISLLIRMDAVLAIGLILAYIALKQPRNVIIPSIVILLFFLALLAFQNIYFGDFLPNTYSLKVNGVPLWERIRVGLLALSEYAMQDFLMPFFVFTLGVWLYKEMQTRETLLLFALFAAQVVYSVWIGGDYAEDTVESANRFIAQGMPALFILSSTTIENMLAKTAEIKFKSSFAFMVAFIAVFTVSGRQWNNWIIFNAPMLRLDIQRAELGLRIKQFTDQKAVIAVHAAGQIPYYSERTTLDLLGKSDPIIAKGAPSGAFIPGHNKWNYEYSILHLQPDLIADSTSKFRAFIDEVPQYQRLPSGVFIRIDSELIDVSGFSE